MTPVNPVPMAEIKTPFPVPIKAVKSDRLVSSKSTVPLSKSTYDVIETLINELDEDYWSTVGNLRTATGIPKRRIELCLEIIIALQIVFDYPAKVVTMTSGVKRPRTMYRLRRLSK